MTRGLQGVERVVNRSQRMSVRSGGAQRPSRGADEASVAYCCALGPPPGRAPLARQRRDARVQRSRVARSLGEGGGRRAPWTRPTEVRSRSSWSRTGRATPRARSPIGSRRRRPRSSRSTSPPPTTARRCAPASSPPMGDDRRELRRRLLRPGVRRRRPGAPREPPTIPRSSSGPSAREGARDERSALRRLVTDVFSGILRYGFGLSVSDTHGMKAMRRDVGRAARTGVPQRHRPLRHRADPAGRARRSASTVELPVVVVERRPSRSPIWRRVPRTLLGLAPPPAPAVASTASGVPGRREPLRRCTVPAPAAGARRRRGGRPDARPARRRRPRPRGVLRLAALRGRTRRRRARAARRCSRPHVLDRHHRERGDRGDATRSRTASGSPRSPRACPAASSNPWRCAPRPRPTAPRSWAGPSATSTPDLLLLAADPFTFPTDAFLRRLDDDRPDLRVLGGFASAAARPGGNRLVVDGRQSPRKAPSAS